MNHSLSPFAHERLDVYRVALRLFSDVEEVVNLAPAGHGDLLRQLRRCAASTVLNIGECANRGHHKDKASRFIIARGECGECACALDLLHVCGLASAARVASLKNTARRVAAMLTGLIRRERRLAESG